ncbi:MAG: MFS transporter [Firmicutes bacterium]|nr:MFS transporter [Bacillota bacterium]
MIPPNFVLAFTLAAYQVLAPFFQEDFGLSLGSVGLVAGATQIGMAITSLGVGWLSDRMGWLRLLFLGQVVMAAAVLGSTRTGSFTILYIMVLIAGMAGAAINPATSKAVVYWFSRNKRGTAIAAMKTGITLGRSSAPAILPALALWAGWRWAVALVAVVAVAWAVAGQILGRKVPETQNGSGNGHERSGIDMKALFRNRGLLLICGTGLIFIGSQVTVSTYFILYLHNVLGYTLLAASGTLAVAQFLGVGGQLLWGFLGDRYFAANRKIPTILMGGIGAASLLFLGLFPKGGPPALLLGIAVVIGTMIYSWSGTLTIMRAEAVPKRMAGTAVGLGGVTSGIGAFTIPPLFGTAVDLTGSYRLAWMMLVGLILLGAALITALPAAAQKDEPGA